MHPRSFFPKNKIIRFFYKFFNKALTILLNITPNFGGQILGAVFYTIDCFLDYFNVNGNSVKLLVIKKSDIKNE